MWNGKISLMDNSIFIDEFISHLYRSAPSIAPDQYRVWALEQLSKVIAFDAAFWGSGNQTQIHFHYVEQLGLDDQYAGMLEATMAINPIKDEVLNYLDKPIDMADVIPDEGFYNSDLYRTLFRPYGIERILASGHLDMKSGLYSLISLYRFDRQQVFSDAEKALQKKLIYHLVSAISHAFFLHLNASQNVVESKTLEAFALCDSEGCFHEAQPRFMALLYRYFPKQKIYTLPIDIPESFRCSVSDHPDTEANLSDVIESHGLTFELTLIGNLIKVGLRPVGPLDKLSEREQQIVLLVCQGLTFKEIAKSLELAPSTISNHLYRVYEKLAISSRTELAKLIAASGLA